MYNYNSKNMSPWNFKGVIFHLFLEKPFLFCGHKINNWLKDNLIITVIIGLSSNQ